MLRSEFEQAIGRAITDAQFCARLVMDPVDALTDYGLGAHEARCLQHLHGASLADLIAQLVAVERTMVGGEFSHSLDRLSENYLVQLAEALPLLDADQGRQSWGGDN